MTHRRSHIGTARAMAAVALMVGLLTVGCAPAQDDSGLGGELREVREAVEATREEVAELRRDVRRHEHQLDSLANRSPRVAAAPPVQAAPAGDELAAAAPEGTDAVPSDAGDVDAPTAEVITRVLQSDEGRAAIQAVAQQVAQRQKARELDTMVSYELSRFARDADLDPHQTTELRRTWEDVMASAREMTQKMRGIDELPPEEQERVRAELRGGMRSLAEERTQRIRSLLDDEQYELYLERQKDIDASLHGAPRDRRRPPESGDEARR